MTQKLSIEGWMRDELERRKQLYRDLFAGRRPESLPVELRLSTPSPYTTREQFRDGEKQLEAALANAVQCWRLGEATDTIPAMRPDVGCSCLATAFGAKYYWGDSESQTPGVREPVVRDLEREVHRLPDPDPTRDGWLPEGLRRIRSFADAGEGFIPVSLLDAAGGVNVAADLLGVTTLLESFYTAPDALHELLDRIQRLFLATIRAGIDAAGGQDGITTTDFPDFWFPEGWKGHASDDISASFGPATYREFSAPYHARVFAEFGGGGLHNCGPNPCHEEYVAHEHSPRSLDLSDRYSHADLPALKRSLKRRAFIYLSFEGEPERAETVEAWYRDVMLTMAPDVVVVPVVGVSELELGSEVGARLKAVAREYAARMEWGWAP